MNILKSIKKLFAKNNCKSNVIKSTAITSLAILISTTIFTLVNHSSATAAPSGNFSIVTNNGNRVDVYGDYLPTYKGPMHLWPEPNSSNVFKLGPNEGTGNEIHLASNQEYCITPDVPLGTKPAPGTLLVAKKDCANSYNFKFEGGKIFMGRYPDMCIDIPNNNDVRNQRMSIHPCNGSPAQQFKTGNQTANSQPQKSVVSQRNDYEYYIMAYRRPNKTQWMVGGEYEVGHAWNAIIRRTVTNYSDGSINQTPWETFKTYAFNPTFENPNKSALTINGKIEFNDTNNYLNGNKTKFIKGIEVRKASISERRALWIDSQVGSQGCGSYDSRYTNLWFIQTGSDKCNCVDFATRNWYLFSANWEDYRPKSTTAAINALTQVKVVSDVVGYRALFAIPQIAIGALDSTLNNLTPDALADSLAYKTRTLGTQFIDSGKTWQ